MSFKSNLIFSLLLVLISGLFSTCGIDSKTKEDNTQPSKLVVELFDLTDSIGINLRKEYLGNLKKIIDKLNGGDNFVCAAITDRSASEGSLIGQFLIPSFHPSTDNDIIIKQEEKLFNSSLKRYNDSIIMVVDSAICLKQCGTPKSEIISALFLASSILKKYDNPKKILVLQSDMIEYTQDLNFYKEKFSDKRINDIIELEIKNRGIPDLDSVVIIVCGARNASSQYQLFDIKKFWLAYFKQCKAILKEENYNALLVKFDE